MTPARGFETSFDSMRRPRSASKHSSAIKARVPDMAVIRASLLNATSHMRRIKHQAPAAVISNQNENVVRTVG